MERPQLSPFDDKTLLFRGWSIRKLGLCVKGKGITICNSDTTDRYRRPGGVRLELKVCSGK